MARRQYRGVAVHQGLDPEYRLLSARATVISRPFGERSLGPEISRCAVAFDDDLRPGRNPQTGLRRIDDLDRASSNSAGEIVFAGAIGNFVAGEQGKQRVLP